MTGRQPRYILFLQNTVFYIFTKYRSASQRLQNIFSRPSDRRPLPAARQTDQPAQPAQPTRPAQPALDRSCSLYFVFSQNIPGLPVQTGRQTGYLLFLRNTVFCIFTKYRSTGQRTGDNCGPSPAQSASQQAQLV